MMTTVNGNADAGRYATRSFDVMDHDTSLHVANRAQPSKEVVAPEQDVVVRQRRHHCA
jgi:hypothetical protein